MPKSRNPLRVTVGSLFNHLYGLVTVVGLFTPLIVWAATCTSNATGTWTIGPGQAGSPWANSGGCGVNGPVAGDTVVLSNLTHTVTIPSTATNASCATISFTGGNRAVTLAIQTSAMLATSGNVTVNAPTANVTKAIDVQAGARLQVGGNLRISGSGASRISQLDIGNSTATTVSVLGHLWISSGNERVVFAGAGLLNIARNLSSGGLFTAANGSTYFDGTLGQNIGIYTYNDLVVKKSSGTATLEGNTTASGNVAVQTGTLDVATFQLTRSPSGGGLTVANGSTLLVGQQTNFPTGFATYSLGPTSTVNYNRAGDQTVTQVDYGHLLLTGSSAKTLPGTTLNVAGNFSMGGTATVTHSNGTVNMNGATGQSIVLTGGTLHNLTIANTAATVSAGSNLALDNNLVINSGALFAAGNFTHSITGSVTNHGTYNGNASVITFSGAVTNNGTYNGNTSAPVFNGSVTNNGTFNATSGTATYNGASYINNGTFNRGTGSVVFGGALAQNISGSVGTNFHNLTLNKSANSLRLDRDTTISNLLTFTAGNISAAGNTLIVSPASGCGVSRTSGHVLGKLRKSFSSGTLTCAFEIGDNADYLPVDVEFSSITTGGTLTASNTSGLHPNIGTSGLTGSKVRRYWTLQNSGIAFGTYKSTFNYLVGDCENPSQASAYEIKRYKAGWADVTKDGTSTCSGTFQTKGKDITDDGDFAIGVVGTVSGIERESQYIYIRERFY